MHTVNRIRISAPPDVVYEFAADICRWPRLLRHYRYVRLLENEVGNPLTRRVKMAASRSGIPVSWTSLQHRDLQRRAIRYEHVGGVTKGMDVVWRLEETPNGTDVVLEHDLPRPRWWLRPAIVQYIVGTVFVHHIADKTLKGIKGAAEAAALEVRA
jgi:uncharacterized membrane protein